MRSRRAAGRGREDHGVRASRHRARRGQRRGVRGGRRPAIALPSCRAWWRRRRSRAPCAPRGLPPASPTGTRCSRQADASGDEACTTNDYGVYDAYWEKNSGYDVERGQNFSEADDEYADFSCFLQVCREVGSSRSWSSCRCTAPGTIARTSPPSERQAYYERVRGIADAAGAAYADFSNCEYEKYFLCDTVHPGWRGWCASSRRSTTSCTIATTPSSAGLLRRGGGARRRATRVRRRWRRRGRRPRDGAGDAGGGGGARRGGGAPPAALGASRRRPSWRWSRCWWGPRVLGAERAGAVRVQQLLMARDDDRRARRVARVRGVARALAGEGEPPLIGARCRWHRAGPRRRRRMTRRPPPTTATARPRRRRGSISTDADDAVPPEGARAGRGRRSPRAGRLPARELPAHGRARVAVAVVDADGVRYLATLGDCPGADAPFVMGSAERKSFTAAAVMQLAEQGTVDLDAPAARYAQGYDVPDEVTVRSLLNQTSGFGSDDSLSGCRQVGDTFGTVLLRERELRPARPRRRGRDGRDVRSVLDEHVLGPLGMTASTADPVRGGGARHGAGAPRLVRPASGRRVPACAGRRRVGRSRVGLRGVQRGGHGFLPAHVPERRRDRRRWARAVARQRAKHVPRPRARSGGDTYYGMGWTSFYWDDGELVLSHDGQVENYVGSMCLLPERGIGVVVLADANDNAGGNDRFFDLVSGVVSAAVGGVPAPVDVAVDGAVAPAHRRAVRVRGAGERPPRCCLVRRTVAARALAATASAPPARGGTRAPHRRCQRHPRAALRMGHALARPARVRPRCRRSCSRAAPGCSSPRVRRSSRARDDAGGETAAPPANAIR